DSAGGVYFMSLEIAIYEICLVRNSYLMDVSGDDSKYDMMRNRVMEGLRSHFAPNFSTVLSTRICTLTIKLLEVSLEV
ncbi:hypothetical protein, partial [Anabaena sp. PCC 7938]|uniref:hypothetical protein n=1 Tax=Anabaena sp. PCC 7938 TaxID=1296340 RepID=UPI00202F82A2